MTEAAPEGMVRIPAGSFAMGIDEEDIDALVRMGRGVPYIERWADKWFGLEVGRRAVEVAAFFMDVREVTNREFDAFVRESGYRPQGDWRKHAGTERSSHPVVNVTWRDATEYAQWAGRRLPTEEEWEYAARGGVNARWFPWGDTPDPAKANYRHEGESFMAGVGRALGLRKIGTAPVGSYPPNGYGLFDMCGNVSEWVDAELEPYPSGPKLESHGKKVHRGGNWSSPNAVYLRVTARGGAEPDTCDWTVGFRCAQS